MLKSVFADRRIWLLALTLALVIIITRCTLSALKGYSWVVHGGYWVTLIMVVLFLRALGPLIRNRWAGAEFNRFEFGVVAAIILIVGTWISHDRLGYKILADEALLSGTAMGMHYEREAAYPARATDVQGSFQVLANVLDKRPLLFPFLAATVHDLTGYRPDNVFYLNIVLSVVLLWLIYLMGWNAGGSRWAGVLALLLCAGLPLLAQQATGGGFELLNLLLLVAFILLTRYYLNNPEDKVSLEALVFGALLLASTRYESAIFLPFAGLGAFLGWMRARQVVLTWPLILSPFFLAPILLQNRIFAGQSEAWQMGSLGVTQPFGFQYVGPNLGHALAFFFDLGGSQPNSPLFAVLGLLSLPFFGLWIVRVVRQPSRYNPTELASALVGSSLFAVTTVYMFYFWGKFDDPLIHRLSLPVHLLMLVAIVTCCAQIKIFRSERAWKTLGLVVTVGVVGYSLPAMARQAYRTTYSPGVEYQIRQDFLTGLSDRNILLIDNDSFFWILHHISASPVMQIQLRKDGLAYHLRNHSFQSMYVFQSVLVNDATGERSIDPVDDLGADFELESVLERRVQTLLFARISRIIAIKTNGEVVARRIPFVEPLKESRSSEKLEEVRSLYLQNWIKHLP